MKTYRWKVLAATILLCATLCAQSSFAREEKHMSTAAPVQQDDTLLDDNLADSAEEKKTFEEDFNKIFEEVIYENPSISNLTLTVDFDIHRESLGTKTEYTPTYSGMKMVKPSGEYDEELDYESESDAASNGVGFWALILAFVVGGVGGYFICANNRGGQAHHDSSTTSMHNRRRYGLESRKSERSDVSQPRLNTVESNRNIPRSENSDLDNQTQLKPIETQLWSNEDNHDSRPKKEERVIANEETAEWAKPKQEPVISPEFKPYEAPQPKKIVKYGQLAVPGENELLLEDDYIVDDPANMPFEFVFDARMYEGTYDLNENLRSMFAEDPDYIRPYVNPFRDVPGAKRIVTLNPGKLRKSGTSWKVIEKLTIELK